MLHTLATVSLLQLALAHALDCYPVLAYYRHTDTAAASRTHQQALVAARDLAVAAERICDAETKALFTGAVLVLEHAVRPKSLPWKVRLAWDLMLTGVTRQEAERPVALAAELLSAFGTEGGASAPCGSARPDTYVVSHVSVGDGLHERGFVLAYALRFEGEAEGSVYAGVVTIMRPFALPVDEVVLESGRSVRLDLLERLVSAYDAFARTDAHERFAYLRTLSDTVVRQDGSDRGHEVSVAALSAVIAPEGDGAPGVPSLQREPVDADAEGPGAPVDAALKPAGQGAA